jgi:hypothetical protein
MGAAGLPRYGEGIQDQARSSHKDLVKQTLQQPQLRLLHRSAGVPEVEAGNHEGHWGSPLFKVLCGALVVINVLHEGRFSRAGLAVQPVYTIFLPEPLLQVGPGSGTSGFGFQGPVECFCMRLRNTLTPVLHARIVQAVEDGFFVLLV